MAFRRRAIRSRAPIRRYRAAARRSIRRRPRRRLRKIRKSPGNFTLIVRRSISVNVSSKDGSTYWVKTQLKEFDEATPFLPYFEAYRIHWIRITVTPHFNVAAPNLNAPPLYCAPWHRPGGIALNTNTILSIDKCRTYNGARGWSRTFVPTVLSSVGVAGAESSYSKTNWRPRMELSPKAQSIDHYGGVVYWSPDSLGTEAHYLPYEVKTTCKLTLYNQKNFAG